MKKRLLSFSVLAVFTICTLVFVFHNPARVAAQGAKAHTGPFALAPIEHGVSTPETRAALAAEAMEPEKFLPPEVGPVFPHHAALGAKLFEKAGDMALQKFYGPKAATVPGLNLVGLGADFAATYGIPYSICCAPPDTNASAGTTQVVETVNLSYAVFDKGTGSVIGTHLLRTLFSSATGCGGKPGTARSDPVVKFDQVAGRWVISFISYGLGGSFGFAPPFLECLAVSSSSNATGSYHTYVYDLSLSGFLPEAVLNDYDKLGMWVDAAGSNNAYFVTSNEFGWTSGGFYGVLGCAFDRASMIAGSGAGGVCFITEDSSGNPTGYSLLPSDLDGGAGAPSSTSRPPAGSPNVLVSLSFNFANALDLWRFSPNFVSPSSSTVVGPITISTAPWTYACGFTTTVCIPQPFGETQQLDSLDDRLMHRNAYRNFGNLKVKHESLVVSHTILAGGSGVTSAVVAGCPAAVRWYEIRDPNGSPSVYQQGTFAPDSSCRWMPSIGQDKRGDMALGYSVSDAVSTYPSVRYTGRILYDPAGTMQSENSVIAGSGTQNGGLDRWGDYSSMAIDPVDDCTFWYAQEYIKYTGAFAWSTRLNSFKFGPQCSGVPAPPPPAVAPQQ